MTFKNPGHMSRAERPSDENEGASQEKQPSPEPVMDEPKNEEPTVLEDTTEKDNARIDEIKQQIEESDTNHKNEYGHGGVGHMHEATTKNREDITKINALKRAAGQPVIQQKKGYFEKIKSFFGGKNE